MKKKNRVLLVAIIALINVSAFAQVKVWTLKESVDFALQNNLQVQQTLLDFETAEQNVVSAKGNFLPTLNGSASHSYNFGSFIGQDGNRVSRDSRGNSFGLNTGVTLFNGLEIQQLIIKQN